MRIQFRDAKRDHGWSYMHISLNRNSVLSGKSGKDTPGESRVGLEDN